MPACCASLATTDDNNWKKAGIDVVVGSARFEDRHTIVVSMADGTSRRLKTRKTVIAVGGTPAPLDVPGGELAITSDAFFDLPTQPKKVAVIGAGYIAVELAGIFHGLGSETRL